MANPLQRFGRALWRSRTRLADAAWALLLVGGLLLFFWLIWDPPR